MRAGPNDTDVAVKAVSPPARQPGPVPPHPQPGHAARHRQAPLQLPPATQDVFCPDGDYTTAWRAEHKQDRQLQSRKRREEQERDLQILENIIKTCAKS